MAAGSSCDPASENEDSLCRLVALVTCARPDADGRILVRVAALGLALAVVVLRRRTIEPLCRDLVVEVVACGIVPTSAMRLILSLSCVVVLRNVGGWGEVICASRSRERLVTVLPLFLLADDASLLVLLNVFTREARWCGAVALRRSQRRSCVSSSSCVMPCIFGMWCSFSFFLFSCTFCASGWMMKRFYQSNGGKSNKSNFPSKESQRQVRYRGWSIS